MLPLNNQIHNLIFLVFSIGIIVSLIQLYRFPRRWGNIIAPLTFFLNGFMYNLFLHFAWINIVNLEFWSGIVRLHGLFLIIIYVLYEPVGKRIK